jgi:hypothetical protein
MRQKNSVWEREGMVAGGAAIFGQLSQQAVYVVSVPAGLIRLALTTQRDTDQATKNG